VTLSHIVTVDQRDLKLIKIDDVNAYSIATSLAGGNVVSGWKEVKFDDGGRKMALKWMLWMLEVPRTVPSCHNMASGLWLGWRMVKL
jgi:hypothetical protein